MLTSDKNDGFLYLYQPLTINRSRHRQPNDVQSALHDRTRYDIFLHETMADWSDSGGVLGNQ